MKSEGNRRGGTNTPNSSGTEKSAPGPSAGKKGGNTTSKGNKSNKGKKNSEKLGGNDKSKHDKDLNNDKDDSDDIDPSAFEIDPDEPTYCLCDQVNLLC